MKKNLLFVFTICSIALTFILFSCGNSKGTGNTARDEMFNDLVAGYNILIDKVPDMINDYDKGITDARIATPKTLRLSPLVNIDVELKKARDFYERGIKEAPASYADLAAAAEKMMDSSDEVYTAYKATNDYIQKKDWQIDTDGTNLAALRNGFKEAGQKFYDATDVVDAGLETIEIETSKADLKKYEKNKSYGYWYRFANIEAKILLNAATTEGYSDALTAFNASLASFDSFVESKGKDVNQSFLAYSKSFHNFANAAEAIHKDFEANDKAAQSRSYSNLIAYYNSLVDISGSLQELEASKLLK